MYSFIDIVAFISIIFLVLSCIEVGSNDATNLVNAVLGSGVLGRKKAVFVAGFFVVLGATFSSPVMDTVRKGIFDIRHFDAFMTISVFIAAYLVSTMLLYIYSIFGMPVSTTATLVFCLAGGALGVLGSFSAINWIKFREVILAILCSIFLSGFFAYFIQRIVRKFLGYDLTDKSKILKHGPWIVSLMLLSLMWFMIAKGMKHIFIVQQLSTQIETFNPYALFFFSWVFLTFLLSFCLRLLHEKHRKFLFHGVAVLGMACMAFAFGQNDLANCASPGITILMIWSQGLSSSLEVSVPIWVLCFCGLLMFLGMMTKRAQRVTRAEISTASQKNDVSLYSPNWCKYLAQRIMSLSYFVKREIKPSRVAMSQKKTSHSGTYDYDALRASVILSVGASVIAFSSGLGLPVSTTYVAFAAVIASGWGDQIFSEANAKTKLGRTIWVITGWFLGAFVAFFVCAFFASVIFKTRLFGLALSLFILFLVKNYCKNKGEVHESRYPSEVKNSQNSSYVYPKILNV